MTDFINKGSLAEVFVGLELRAAYSSTAATPLFYWHRETRSSNAEVDYLVQQGSRIVPIEVKSGKRGSMQGMAVFLAEHPGSFGIRLSIENRSRYKDIIVLPLYCARNLVTQKRPDNFAPTGPASG